MAELTAAAVDGSSPLARGTHKASAAFSKTNGLIPARAGNTGEVEHYRVPFGAHPRSRGEHGLKMASGEPQAGSSPARAGNTLALARVVKLWRAHPRSRGEHVRYELLKVQQPGSSPLARGTRHPFFMPLSWCGLIPARAGNTNLEQ